MCVCFGVCICLCVRQCKTHMAYSQCIGPRPGTVQGTGKTGNNGFRCLSLSQSSVNTSVPCIRPIDSSPIASFDPAQGEHCILSRATFSFSKSSIYTVLPARKQSSGKIMFLHLSVILSIGRYVSQDARIGGFTPSSTPHSPFTPNPLYILRPP